MLIEPQELLNLDLEKVKRKKFKESVERLQLFRRQKAKHDSANDG